MYNSILKNGCATIEIKKSTFISHAFFVKDEEKALEIIDDVSTKYRDATHNCYAYIIGEDANIERYSDDGEPSGTAGVPMLEVLKKKELRNILVISTRYFGGIKLGAGGLVRAYTSSVVEALNASTMTLRKIFNRTSIKYDYTFHGKILNYLAGEGVKILKENYSDLVEVIVDLEDKSHIIKDLIDLTSANVEFKKLEEVELPTIDGKIIY